MRDQEWWRGAVIYQIYPRSFKDSNGDGVGDLQGIINKLDYIASLGVDAIWVSPFFKSPMKDFGYDISDYRAVDPLFGSLQDFDRLIARAHALGIRVIIDQVLSHTSDQHAWFLQSREDRDNPKSDWYVWADPKADGTVPNNWLALFGGAAWEWEPRRKQYYLHNFLRSQPDLNFHNPDVQRQILHEVEFWLQRGIDGLRLDAINFCFHDKSLRDNPPKAEELRKGRGFTEDNPYAFQHHFYDNTQPENIAFIQSLRELLERYPGVAALGEVSSEDSLATMAEYTAGNQRLHMAYSFELLVDTFSADYIRQTTKTLEAGIGDGWPCWAIGNHDVARVMTRWGGDQPPDDLAKVLTATLCSLRGSVCFYQGEELGLTEADIPPEKVQDPYGITFWPMFKGRDGCRTPIPWTSAGRHAGFSESEAWLPLDDKHRRLSVEVQEADPNSILQAYRRFIKWRKTHPALRYGDIRFVDAAQDVLAFVRCHAREQIFVCLNLSSIPQTVTIPENWNAQPLQGHGFPAVDYSTANASIALPAYDAFFARITA